MFGSLLKHPLFQTLFSLRGNPRACVYTEPLWGIPYNLYAPYVSVYMLALGLSDSQIGLLLSVNLAVQIVSSLLSGPITDRLGRRKATFIFDFVCWSVPTIIWAISQNFTYFLIAAIINGSWRITHTSWTCLLVEDANEKQLVDIYSWVYISGLLSAFFAPIAGLLISRYTLVPTMRGLYILAFVLMSAKFIILYIYSKETKQGQVRMQETQSQSFFHMLRGYKDVVKTILQPPATLYTLGIMIAMTTANTIHNTFWSVIVTQRVLIPDAHIALYPFARSIIMLVFFFLAMPLIKEMKFRNPMLVGFMGLALGQLILVLVPQKSYALLLVSTLLEACSYATVSTQIDRMMVVTVNANERARISALMFLVVIIFSTPFGWIAGQLSEISRVLPFVLNISFYLIGAVLVLLTARAQVKREQAAALLTVSPVDEIA